MAGKRTKRVGVRVTGRSVVYVQDVKKGGKLGKARPVVLTTVAAGPVAAPPKRKRTRR